MKHFGKYAVALALSLGFAASAAAQQTPRLGWINSQRIRAEAPGVAEARKTLEGEVTRSRAQVDSLSRELQRLESDFQRQQASLSATVRQQREQEFQQRLNGAQQRVAQLEQTMQRREAELFGPINQRINEAVEAVRKEGNYAMIFDAAVLATADPTLDLTTRVLERLRRPAGR